MTFIGILVWQMIDCKSSDFQAKHHSKITLIQQPKNSILNQIRQTSWVRRSVRISTLTTLLSNMLTSCIWHRGECMKSFETKLGHLKLSLVKHDHMDIVITTEFWTNQGNMYHTAQDSEDFWSRPSEKFQIIHNVALLTPAVYRKSLNG